MRPQQCTARGKMGNVLWMAVILVLWAGSSAWAFTLTCKEFVDNHCDGTPVENRGNGTEVVDDGDEELCPNRLDCLCPFAQNCHFVIETGQDLRLKNIILPFGGRLSFSEGRELLIEGSNLDGAPNSDFQTSGMDILRIKQRTQRSFINGLGAGRHIDLNAKKKVVVEKSVLNARGNIYIDPNAPNHKVTIERSDLTADGIIEVTSANDDIFCNRSNLTADKIGFGSENGLITTMSKCTFTMTSDSRWCAEGSLKVRGKNRGDPPPDFVCPVPGTTVVLASFFKVDARYTNFDDCDVKCRAPRERDVKGCMYDGPPHRECIPPLPVWP